MQPQQQEETHTKSTHLVFAECAELVFAVVVGADGFEPLGQELVLGREYGQQTTPGATPADTNTGARTHTQEHTHKGSRAHLITAAHNNTHITGQDRKTNGAARTHYSNTIPT